MQDVCIKISSVALLVQDLCMRVSCAYLCVRISPSGSCVATCARSFYADYLCKISLSGSLHQDLCRTTGGTHTTLSAFRAMETHHLRRGSHWESRNRNFTSFSRDGHARISAEGCTSKSKIATLPAFRAMDTHDLRRRLHFGIGNRNFIQHFARRTRAISAEGCTSKSEIAISPAFRALDTHDLRKGGCTSK